MTTSAKSVTGLKPMGDRVVVRPSGQDEELLVLGANDILAIID